MDPLLYKVIHLAGIMGLFSAMGAVIAGMCTSCKKMGMILHGVSLLLILISGFGMIAKFGYGMGGWVYAKIVIFIILGALPAFAKKEKFPKPVAMGILLFCGIAAAYLGVKKPF